MADNFRACLLGDVIELKRGYDLPTSRRTKGQVPLVSSSGVSDYISEPAVKAPGVVTGRYGTIGEVHYLTQDFWPLNTTLYVRDFKGNHPRFISYFLRLIDFHTYSDKAAVPGVNRNHLHSARVRVPPFPIQKRIAEILGALDDKIEVNRRMIATLQEMAGAIFKSWFLDFDPVRAKAEGRATNLPDEIVTLFPDSLDESELGLIPSGWAIGSISDLAEVGGGSTPSTKDARLWDGGIAWATPKDLSRLSHPVLLQTERTISEAGLSSISSELYPPGTVLMSSRAPIGYLAISEIPVAVNQGFIALKPRVAMGGVFLLPWLESHMNEINGRANGSTFMEISKSAFRSIQTVLPPKGIIDAYGKIATPIFRRLVEATEESSSLADIRDALLPKLISGEIGVMPVEVRT